MGLDLDTELRLAEPRAVKIGAVAGIYTTALSLDELIHEQPTHVLGHTLLPASIINYGHDKLRIALVATPTQAAVVGHGTCTYSLEQGQSQRPPACRRPWLGNVPSAHLHPALSGMSRDPKRREYESGLQERFLVARRSSGGGGDGTIARLGYFFLRPKSACLFWG